MAPGQNVSLDGCTCVHTPVERKLLFPHCIPHLSPSPQLLHHRPFKKRFTWLAG